MPCRVFIADDVQGLRALWAELLAEHGDIEIVGDAGDGEAAIEGVRETRPDVLVLDLSMPRVDGLEVIRTLREAVPETSIVVASGFSSERLAPIAMSLGACAYFEKGSSVERLREAVLAACTVDRGPAVSPRSA